jgi:hypothetical protein
MGGEEAEIHSFLESELDTSECSVSDSSHFIPEKKLC